MTEISEYQQQALDFLNKTGATIEISFLKSGKHFDDDKEDRDIYSITITRGSRKYTFNFGNSTASSGKYVGHKHMCTNRWGKYKFTEQEYKKMNRFETAPSQADVKKNPNFKEPSEYDILACLTKYDPGTLDNFCSEYGYEADSKKADKTYHAVRDEYVALCSLFNDEELGLMSEIQ